MPDPNKKLDDINIADNIEPTATDTLNAYLFQNLPSWAEGTVKSVDPNLLTKAEVSSGKTGTMTYDDFMAAKESLGLISNEDIMHHLTGKRKKDLDWKTKLKLTPVLKHGGRKQLGGTVKGTGKWGGKDVPGMIGGRHK